MGELINLRLRPALTAPTPERIPTAREATILLFTGIRYERMAEPPPARETPDPKKPRGRRRA